LEQVEVQILLSLLIQLETRIHLQRISIVLDLQTLLHTILHRRLIQVEVLGLLIVQRTILHRRLIQVEVLGLQTQLGLQIIHHLVQLERQDLQTLLDLQIIQVETLTQLEPLGINLS
jgi:hypothetical protein